MQYDRFEDIFDFLFLAYGLFVNVLIATNSWFAAKMTAPSVHRISLERARLRIFAVIVALFFFVESEMQHLGDESSWAEIAETLENAVIIVFTAVSLWRQLWRGFVSRTRIRRSGSQRTLKIQNGTLNSMISFHNNIPCITINRNSYAYWNRYLSENNWEWMCEYEVRTVLMQVLKSEKLMQIMKGKYEQWDSIHE